MPTKQQRRDAFLRNIHRPVVRVEYHRPISIDMANAIACEIAFRRSDWFFWSVSPFDKDRDRKLAPGHWERADLRKRYALERLTNLIGN